MLIYPPGKAFQRGEDRCQGNINDSSTMVARTPIDLAYLDSILTKNNFKTFTKDYQSVDNSTTLFENLIEDIASFLPDIIFISTTTGSIYNDLKLINDIKKQYSNITFILKGALFFDADLSILEKLDLSNVDFLVGGEVEFILDKLLLALNENTSLHHINGIFFKQNTKWIKTSFSTWEQDISSLPFPNHSIFESKKYIRPDTREPQITITTSRGCNSACSFCLTPIISGTKVRFRTPENIVAEIKSIIKNNNINNFFFRSDTFTIDKDWVTKLCQLIIDENLENKISWVANSRAYPLDEEVLLLMKKAGCWLVAVGFESGDPITLNKIRKGTTIEHNLRAAQMIKSAGLELYGFFMIGFPWDDHKSINRTREHIFKLAPDYLEVHIATPYYGTKLLEDFKELNLLNFDPLGTSYFQTHTSGTMHLSKAELESIHRNLLLKYHIQPSFILRHLLKIFKRPKIIIGYLSFIISKKDYYIRILSKQV